MNETEHERLIKKALNDRDRHIDLRLDGLDVAVEEVRKIAQHQDPSPRTMAMFDAINEQNSLQSNILSDLVSKIDLIFPNAKEQLDEAVFWHKFWEKMVRGGNGLKWIAGIIIAVVLITGSWKTILAFLINWATSSK